VASNPDPINKTVDPPVRDTLETTGTKADAEEFPHIKRFKTLCEELFW
jgi:hypothetical protein